MNGLDSKWILCIIYDCKWMILNFLCSMTVKEWLWMFLYFDGYWIYFILWTKMNLHAYWLLMSDNMEGSCTTY